MRRGSLFLMLAFLAAPLFAPALAQPLKLILPTRNDALLYGDGPSFFQYTNRYFNGERSTPWEGGQYGYVRNAKETSEGIVYTRFHEGMDIKPLYRDGRGEPLDTVRVIDAGEVVYANFQERDSNYGKYVVVEHWWSGAPFYSLYAHLGSVTVHKGQRLRQGEQLGIMGYTGAGIDRVRAHVHFEINMLLSEGFNDWHKRHYRRGRNEHGIYNGINLAGIDVAKLYLALQRDPTLTIRKFIERQEAYFTVRMPNTHVLDLHYRYPWLAGISFDLNAPSVEVSFTQSGAPVRVASSYEPAGRAEVAGVRYSGVSYGLTTSYLSGQRGSADLSGSGGRYVDLLTMETPQTRSGSVPVALAEYQPPVQRPEIKPAVLTAPAPERARVHVVGWSESEPPVVEPEDGDAVLPAGGGW